MSTKRLLVVAHAPSPNTRAMLDAVVEGAGSPDIEGVKVDARSPFDTAPEHVLGAGAIILGTTENLGYMSGALKDFFDRIYYPCLEETQGLAYALYIRAGHDGTGTRRAVGADHRHRPAVAGRAGAADLPRCLGRRLRRAIPGARHGHGRRSRSRRVLSGAIRLPVPKPRRSLPACHPTDDRRPE